MLDTTTLNAIIAAISSIFIAITPLVIKRVKLRKSKKGFISHHKVYEALNKAIANTSAARVILIKATNGGGIPVAGEPVYTTICYEITDGNDSNKPIKHYWQKREMDGSYAKTIYDIISKKRFQIITSSLPKGTLRTQYEADGIVSAQVYYIHHFPEKLYYMAVHLKHELPLTPVEINHLEHTANELKNILADSGR